jgi:hypothetical protein
MILESESTSDLHPTERMDPVPPRIRRDVSYSQEVS